MCEFSLSMLFSTCERIESFLVKAKINVDMVSRKKNLPLGDRLQRPMAKVAAVYFVYHRGIKMPPCLAETELLQMGLRSHATN